MTTTTGRVGASLLVTICILWASYISLPRWSQFRDLIATVAPLPKGVTFFRTISLLPNEAILKIQLNSKSHCLLKDAYGDNACHYGWDSTMSGNVTLTYDHSFATNDYFEANILLDKFSPYKVRCHLCGQDCVVDIPILGLKYTIPMPSCPLSTQQDVHQEFSFHLPPTGLPFLTQIEATVRVVEGDDGIRISNGNRTLARATVVLSVI